MGFNTKNKMGGKQSKLTPPPRVSDPLAGNYDAVKSIDALKGRDTELTTKVHGTSATLQNQKAPNMGMAVLGRPVKVSSKEFKKNVKITSSTKGLV